MGAVRDRLIEERGDIWPIEAIPEDARRRYPTAYRIPPSAYIQVAAPAQKWVDMGISRNLYLQARDLSAMEDVYLEAWRRGLKSTYYLFMAPRMWKAALRAAVRRVRDGKLAKVVLARGLRVHGTHLDPLCILRRFRAGYPGCAIFAFANGSRCFLGASPERLVRLRRGEVHVSAVAGSAPRGLTKEEDRRVDLADMTRECGFEDVRFRLLTGGIAVLHIAVKSRRIHGIGEEAAWCNPGATWS